MKDKKITNGSHFTKDRSEGCECIKPAVSQHCLALPPVGHVGCFGDGGPHTSFWTVSRGPCCLSTSYRFEDTDGHELPCAQPGGPRIHATPDVFTYHLAPLARLSQSPTKTFSLAGMRSHLGQRNFLLEGLSSNFFFQQLSDLYSELKFLRILRQIPPRMADPGIADEGNNQ